MFLFETGMTWCQHMQMPRRQNNPPRILIVGLGVAGACLYWRLRELGAKVTLADPNESATSSRAAAGLITPITGANFALSWRFAEIWPESLKFYQNLAALTGESFFHPLPVVRLFSSDAEAAKFTRKVAHNPFLETYLDLVFSASDAPSELLGSEVTAPHGGFVMPGGWVNTSTLIEETRRELILTASYREQMVTSDALDLSRSTNTDHPVQWNGESFDLVVFCEGANSRHNPLFTDIPFRPAKGEFLTLKAPQASAKAIINRKGSWLAPRHNNEWRAGSSYDFERLDIEPTAQGREQILTNISTFYSGELSVIAASAGVRPIIRKSQPVAGFHADHQRTIAMLNGLGSKGCSTGPWAAGHLAHAIVNGTPLPPYLDLAQLANNPQ